MQNNRDSKYNDQEESEYHFSDEDISYEVEPEEQPEATQSKAPVASKAKGLMNKLSQSKRMIISALVFLVLIFIVYKMVSPTSTSTEIAALPKAEQATATPAQLAGVTPTVPLNQTPSATVTPAAPQPPMQNPVQAAAIGQPASQVQQVQHTQTVATPPVTTQQAVVQPVQQVANQIEPYAQPQTGTLPTVIPVQAPINQAAEANLSAESNRAVGQLQSEYNERLNELATQNKAMQEHIQMLNQRVANMETQMTQLIHTLTQRRIPHALKAQPL